MGECFGYRTVLYDFGQFSCDSECDTNSEGKGMSRDVVWMWMQHISTADFYYLFQIKPQEISLLPD